MAVGMLDRTSGLAMACGAEVVVIRNYLFGRERAPAVDAVVEQLAELRERLEGKGRDVAFGMEVMGRVNELGSLEDVLSICSLDWVRPMLDFAHLHAVSDGGYTEAEPSFREALAAADSTIEAGAPFTSTSRTSTSANRNEVPPLARNASRRSARRGPCGVRAAGHGHRRVARRGVEPGDPRGSRDGVRGS